MLLAVERPLGIRRLVFHEPDVQRDVLGVRVVAAIVGPVSEYLSADGVELFIQVFDGHRVFGAKPPVAVAIPENFSWHIARVRAPRMPGPTIQENG